MLDTMQIIFWTITYLLIIIAGYQNRETRTISMPYVAGVLNFGWEACALQQSQGFWGHILWFALDCAIVYFGFNYLKSTKHRIAYIASIYFVTFVFSYVFTLPNGMMLSSFAIDLIMAVWFLLDRRKLSSQLKVSIAVTKLIGDAFAGLFYASMSAIVEVLAVMVFVCNSCYLYLCIREKYAHKSKN